MTIKEKIAAKMVADAEYCALHDAHEQAELDGYAHEHYTGNGMEGDVLKLGRVSKKMLMAFEKAFEKLDCHYCYDGFRFNPTKEYCLWVSCQWNGFDIRDRVWGICPVTAE